MYSDAEDQALFAPSSLRHTFRKITAEKEGMEVNASQGVPSPNLLRAQLPPFPETCAYDTYADYEQALVAWRVEVDAALGASYSE